MVKEVKSLLGKYSRLKPKGSLLKKIIQEVIFSNYNITIPPNFISIRNKTAFLKTSPALKSEIILNKKKINTELERLSSGAIGDIR